MMITRRSCWDMALIIKNGLLNKLDPLGNFSQRLAIISYALAGIPYMGVGRNLAYKKTVFFRHKGFRAHNNIPGGDDDLFINTAATKKILKINIDKEALL